MHLRAITIASHCLTPPEFILSSFCSVRLCQQNLTQGSEEVVLLMT